MATWRASPWLADPSGRSQEQQSLHEAALGVLDEHDATGRPFALYLRAFSFRQLYGHRLDGNGVPIDDDPAAVPLDEHLRAWLGRRAVGLVRVQDVSPVMGLMSFFSRAPALMLRSETWLDAVEALMRSAELIVSECQGLSPGVIAELGACVRLGRADRTVLVLPSPPMEFVGNEREVYDFGRAIHQHELDTEQPARSPVLRDLIARLARIARLTPDERLRLAREGRLDEAFPVPFKSAAAASLRLAGVYAARENVGAAFYAGTRAVKIVERSAGEVAAVPWRLRLADLCARAGNEKLALVELDDADAVVAKHAADADAKALGRLTAAARRRRQKILGEIFQPMLDGRDFPTLWRWANSQGAFALKRHDVPVFAQCMSWMAVAAVGAGNYALGKDHATDAVMLARQCHDRFREGFASVYLGHALRGLGEIDAALKAYGEALRLLRGQKPRRLNIVLFLSIADVARRLGQTRDQLATLYKAALDLAEGLGEADLAAAARAGMDAR
jgi:tetratricopeptide (TPR) repeat protein